MKWHDFVFSDQPRLRYRRHIIFWVAWLVYFAGTLFYKQEPFIQDGLDLWLSLILIKSIFILAGHAFICYGTIYFLLPQLLLKNKYFIFSILLLAGGVIITALTYFYYSWLFPLLDKFFHYSNPLATNTLLWYSILSGFLSSLKPLAIAVTIKLLKRWCLKQKENMLLEREKINADLQLLKTQIHPDFLFSSLDKIYYYAQNKSPNAASLLLKLSDLMSYMLYECNDSLVLLEKEVQMVRDFLELEKNRLDDRLDISIRVKGDLKDKMIAPLILLPFIENSFLYCENKNEEKCWLTLDFKIAEDELFLKLINGKSSDETIIPSLTESGIANVKKRLDMIYQNSYELNITVQTEYMITSLKIQLEEVDRYTFSGVKGEEKDHNHFTNYAII